MEAGGGDLGGEGRDNTGGHPCCPCLGTSLLRDSTPGTTDTIPESCLVLCEGPRGHKTHKENRVSRCLERQSLRRDQSTPQHRVDCSVET
jgi:hypothetical protein